MVESTNNTEVTNETTLVAFNFGQLNIKVYGTEEDPLFKCSDIMIHVLKYKQTKDANWFRTIDEELKLMYIRYNGGIPCFNE